MRKPEDPAIKKARMLKYRATHSVEIAAQQKLYRDKHSEQMAAYKREYKIKNHDALIKYENERQREQYATDPIFSEKSNAKSAKWRRDNPGYHKEYLKQLSLDNKDRLRERRREYSRIFYAENKDKIKQRGYKNSINHGECQKLYSKSDKGKTCSARYKHKARDLTKSLPHDLTCGEWLLILCNQNNECNMCHVQFSKEIPPTRDHIIPLTKGGGFTKTNIQALCSRCNSRKGNKIIQLISRDDPEEIPSGDAWVVYSPVNNNAIHL